MGPSKPLEEWTTPELVREYSGLRVTASLLAIRQTGLNPEQHAWLGAVVDELRKRGVLD